MNIALIILGGFLGLGVTGSAMGKLTKKPSLIAQLGGLGVPANVVPVLGLLEIAGALGLLVGIWVTPLGIAAAVGLTLYFVGAVGAHVRHHDAAKDLAPAAFFLLMSIATLILEIKR